MPAVGALLCLASAVAFGAMAILGKLAYDDGATVGTLLSVRFLLAAALLWALVVCSGATRRLRLLSRRDLCAALALGRERASRRSAGALALSSGGLVLVLAGAAAGALDPLGAALGLSAAVVYTVYILTSAGVARRVEPLVLSALICTGAAITLTLAGAARGDLHAGSVSVAGFGWLAGIAVVSTVAAVTLFFAGLRRVGPTAASILSTAEPVTTVILAYLAFVESLGPAQLAGAALVLAAVPVLAARGHRPPAAVPRALPRADVGWRVR